MLVLGIESSCDETACAVVKDGKTILSNIVSSQIDLHKEYGGVVPELACRRHIELIMPVIELALKEAGCTLDDIDLIAATHGPGLIGALLVGLTTAKSLALAANKPFIGINHIEAHLYAAIMSHPNPVTYPCLGVVLSGAHTNLLLVNEIGSYRSLGQTIDDAIGESFDKIARMLDLPYPGGPEIEKIAHDGDAYHYSFKSGQIKGSPLDFSFSGIKTAVLYTLQKEAKPYSDELKNNIAASFQRAVFEDVIKKAFLAASQNEVHTLLFGGGVTNSQTLQTLFQHHNKNRCQLVWPFPGLNLDNAAMIAGLAFHKYLAKGCSDSLDLLPEIRIPF